MNILALHSVPLAASGPFDLRGPALVVWLAIAAGVPLLVVSVAAVRALIAYMKGDSHGSKGASGVMLEGAYVAGIISAGWLIVIFLVRIITWAVKAAGAQ